MRKNNEESKQGKEMRRINEKKWEEIKEMRRNKMKMKRRNEKKWEEMSRNEKKLGEKIDEMR